MSSVKEEGRLMDTKKSRRGSCLATVIKILVGLSICGVALTGAFVIVRIASRIDGGNPTPTSRPTSIRAATPTRLTATNTPEPTVEINRLEENSWWEFAWTEYEESGGMGLDKEISHTNGIFRITLGAPVVVKGIKLYPIIVSGDPGNFRPRWAMIGAEPEGGMVGESSQFDELQWIYKGPGTQERPGDGFFADFARPEDVGVYSERQIQLGQRHRYTFPDSARATQVGYSENESNCRNSVVGRLCTDDPDVSRHYYEYWPVHFSPVPVAMHYDFWYEDCGGGFCTYKQTEKDVTKIGSSE
jgi:hypothetical protein